MKILITGIAGFVGRYLVEQLTGEGAGESSNEILGIDIKLDSAIAQRIPDHVDLLEADLTDPKKVKKIIAGFKPREIYHLAAQSSVSYSWKNPVDTFRVNVFGGINILESIKDCSPSCKILMVCTAEEYSEAGGKEKPIDENFKIYPRNPYAISKAALDFFSTVYSEAYGMPVLVARSFNHIGPGQSDRFVASDFARQIALIEKGRQRPLIKVGNLEAWRDFLDVRDVVRAYISLVSRGKVGGVYNVCSGRKTKISDLLDMLLSLSSRKDIKVKTDSSKFRPIDIATVYGDNKKLRAHTGWSPEYSIKNTLSDTLQYWRNEV